jgi:penicillin-binding protein 1C
VYVRQRIPLIQRRRQSRDRMTNALKKIKLVAKIAATTSLVILLFIVLLATFLPYDIDMDYSRVVHARNGEVIGMTLNSEDKWRFKAEYVEVSEEFINSIINKEDKYFKYHNGVNLFAVCRALFNNISSGRKTSGASTITMQLARMLEPKERTYLNKTIEMFRAFQIELRYSKKEILEMYINLLPYGGNIEGVKAASYLYLNKSPQALSLKESVALAVIPNKPSSLRISGGNDAIEEMANKWIDIFYEEGSIGKDDYEQAKAESFMPRRRNSPTIAKHITRRLIRENPKEKNIWSSIDFDIQWRAEQITSNYMSRFYDRNIRNSAVLIVDRKSLETRAYIGNNDFYDRDNAGQVDGVTAIRSPGSTLKPLLYAMAIDDGLITPKTILLDVPLNYGDYSPENFDKDYSGEVSAEEALARSLNVPAVYLMNQLGVGKFTRNLKKCGFREIQKQSDKLGLSIALGGCGVSLEELVMHYSSYANEGKLVRINHKDGEREIDTVEVISPESAFLISDMLSKLERPDFPSGYRNVRGVPNIAWKTGTSYGRRDAWSIGFNEEYVIGVWVGNFSNEGVSYLTGASVATPLLFELFRELSQKHSGKWMKRPENLMKRKVCIESGAVANDFCDNLVEDYYIPLVSSQRKCQHLKEIYVNEDETVSFCESCCPDEGYKKKLYENHQKDLINYFDYSEVVYEKIPEHNPNCESLMEINKPKIVNPIDGFEYFLEKGTSDGITFECNLANDASSATWLVDDVVFKVCSRDESAIFQPKEEGKYYISCSDDRGRNSNITISVKFY